MNGTHWATDPDLLERYARGKVLESERKQLDEHLRTCLECRARLKDETGIVEGIKMFGRGEMKDMLQQRLAHEPSRRIPWTRIMSVAATIVIIVGISFFNEWFPPQPKQKVESKPAETLGDKKDQFPERAAAQKQEISDLAKDREMDLALESKVGKETKIEAPKKLQFDGAKREDRSALSAAAQSGTGAGQQRTLSLDEMKDQKMGQVDDQVWVEGTVMTQTDKHEEFGKVSWKKTVQDAQIPKAETQLSVQQGVHLQQMPSRNLPAAQQQKQRLSNVNSVQTLVSRTNQGLKMTLYLDTLLQDADFRNASVQEVEPDSIVIDLPNQRIGYQLPSGWTKKTAKKHNRD
jgi:hypothetical protein